MALRWPKKDPDEVLDYDVKWVKRLNGDTILTSIFFVADGDVIIDSNTETTTIAKVWLSGGTLDEECLVTNRITTAGLRTMDQSVKIKIGAK